MGVPFPHAGWVAPSGGLEEGELQFTPPPMAQYTPEPVVPTMPTVPNIPGLQGGPPEPTYAMPQSGANLTPDVVQNVGTNVHMPTFGVDLETGFTLMEGNPFTLSDQAIREIKHIIARDVAAQMRLAADALLDKYGSMQLKERRQETVPEGGTGRTEAVREVSSSIPEGDATDPGRAQEEGSL